jgi:hypothetical protein
VNAFGLWKPEVVRITSGAEHVATFQKTSFSQRQYPTECGAHFSDLAVPRDIIFDRSGAEYVSDAANRLSGETRSPVQGQGLFRAPQG